MAGTVRCVYQGEAFDRAGPKVIGSSKKKQHGQAYTL
jgi:hypothetical protein